MFGHKERLKSASYITELLMIDDIREDHLFCFNNQTNVCINYKPTFAVYYPPCYSLSGHVKIANLCLMNM